MTAAAAVGKYFTTIPPCHTIPVEVIAAGQRVWVLLGAWWGGVGQGWVMWEWGGLG